MTQKQLELLKTAKEHLHWNNNNSPHPDDVAYALGIIHTVTTLEEEYQEALKKIPVPPTPASQ